MVTTLVVQPPRWWETVLVCAAFVATVWLCKRIVDGGGGRRVANVVTDSNGDELAAGDVTGRPPFVQDPAHA